MSNTADWRFETKQVHSGAARDIRRPGAATGRAEAGRLTPPIAR